MGFDEGVTPSNRDDDFEVESSMTFSLSGYTITIKKWEEGPFEGVEIDIWRDTREE